MTIRQLHDMTPADQKIYIGWQGITQELDRSNTLELHAHLQTLRKLAACISPLSTLAKWPEWPVSAPQ